MVSFFISEPKSHNSITLKMTPRKALLEDEKKLKKYFEKKNKVRKYFENKNINSIRKK